MEEGRSTIFRLPDAGVGHHPCQRHSGWHPEVAIARTAAPIWNADRDRRRCGRAAGGTAPSRRMVHPQTCRKAEQVGRPEHPRQEAHRPAMTQVSPRTMTSRGPPTLQLGDDSDALAGLRPRATVLVVDDDPWIRDTTGRILEHAQYRVVQAASAEEARV